MPATDSRPNILVFMTDQQRGATVLPGDRWKAKTPRLDQFREQSTTFSRAYCPSPHCCPSRASFFTGLYPSQHGVWNNVNVASALSRGPVSGTPFWSEGLKEAGYDLHFAGKWHVANHDSPANHGWKVHYPDKDKAPREQPDRETQDRWCREGEARAFTGQPQHDVAQMLAGEREPGEIVRPGYWPYTHYGFRDNPFNDQTVTDCATAVLRDGLPADGSPWFLYTGTLGPHDTYHLPEEFVAMYADEPLPELPESFYDSMADKPAFYRRTRDRFDQLSEEEHRTAIRHYLAFCTYEDYLFGQLLDALEASGQADNTVVIYMSDHGDYMAEHGLWTKGLPSFESAYHIPVIARWPGYTDAPEATYRQVDAPVSLVDFAPTFLEMAGLPDAAQGLEGHSLVPFLQGRPDAGDDWRDAMFFQSNGNESYGMQRIVQTRKWKLVFNTFDYDELYDLENDPHEMTNLIAVPADRPRQTGAHPLRNVPEHLRPTVEELYRRLWEFALSHQDVLVNEYIATAMGTFGPRIGKH